MPDSIKEKHNSNLFLYFSVFWSISTLIHQLIWSEWSSQGIPLGWFVTLFCVSYLFTGAKYKILFVLGILSSAVWYTLRQPLVVNHLFFETIMSLLMSVVILSYYVIRISNRKTVSLINYFTNNAIPLLRTSIIILYFFAVLHKLNHDYFKTDLSCGSVLFENMLSHLKLMQIGFIENFYSNHQTAIANFSIYFSIVAELIIPILLLFKRSRTFGIVFGMLFHFVLALEGLGAIVSFTAMMFTYLILFSSDEIISKAINLGRLYTRHLRIGFAIAFILIAICFFFFSSGVFNKAVGFTWIIYTIATLLFYLKNVRLINNYSIKFSSKSIVFWIFPLITFLNGFSPYLGLKTNTAFSMFSNLSTENGKNNHLFIPDSFQVFDYQKEMVVITETNIENLKPFDPWNKDKSSNYLLFEFVKHLSSVENGYVHFEINGTPYYVEKIDGNVIETDIELIQNSLLLKILMFRPIYSDNISYCRQ